MSHRKLAISLVPPALWGINLKKILSRGDWDRIRFAAFAEEPACACGAVPSGPDRHGHEEWRYRRRGATATALLLGVRTACRKCHLAKHPGFVAVMTARGVFPRSLQGELERHYCAVNGCTPADHAKDLAAAEARLVDLMAVRKWRVDFGPCRRLVASRLPGRRAAGAVPPARAERVSAAGRRNGAAIP